MAFRFPLESVLRLRQNLEHQQELLLYKANQAVITIAHQIEQLDTGMAENARERLLELQSGMSAAHLQFSLLRDSMLRQSRHHLEKKLSEAENARAACRESFRHARQQREVMETLRRHQLELYRELEARQEQRRTDDLFLLRRAYQAKL